MTKASLAEKLHISQGITRKEATSHVDALLDLIKDTLEQGTKVKVPGFGVFDLRQKHARRGRNPQTGEAIVIEPRKILTFKPSKVLVAALNRNQP